MLLSVIIPCYNGQEVLPVFYQEFKKVMQDMPAEYELLFIDDGSKDGTLEILRSLSRKDSHVSYLSFSRNFGKESAIYAGFCNVHGCGFAGPAVHASADACDTCIRRV